VVGNSGTLTGAGLGAIIDDHDAVFRFHHAPLHRFETDVGVKTSFQVNEAQTAQTALYPSSGVHVHHTSQPMYITTPARPCFDRLPHRLSSLLTLTHSTQVLDQYWLDTLMANEAAPLEAKWWAEDATLLLWSPFSQEAFTQLRQLYPTSSIALLSRNLLHVATSAAATMRARLQTALGTPLPTHGPWQSSMWCASPSRHSSRRSWAEYPLVRWGGELNGLG